MEKENARRLQGDVASGAQHGIGALLPEKMKILSRGSRLRVGENPNR